jgi:anti-anti-sigma factor
MRGEAADHPQLDDGLAPSRHRGSPLIWEISVAALELDVQDPDPQAGGPFRTLVEIRELSAHTTIVALIGEHDLFTKLRLVEALEQARMAPVVIIDLTACTFVDSTIIETFVRAVRRSLAQRVEFVLPVRRSIVERALSLVGASDFLTIHASLERALASTQPARADV